MLSCLYPYSDLPLEATASADQEPVLPLFPLLAVRMKVLAGRKKCLLGCLQLRSLRMCPDVPLAGRMQCLAGHMSLGWLQLMSLLVCPAVRHADHMESLVGRMNVVWDLLQVPTDPTLLA